MARVLRTGVNTALDHAQRKRERALAGGTLPVGVQHPEDFPGEYRPSTVAREAYCCCPVDTSGIPGAAGYLRTPYYAAEPPYTPSRESGKFVLLAAGKKPEFLLVEQGRIKRGDSDKRRSSNMFYLTTYLAFRRVTRPDVKCVKLKPFPSVPPSETK